MDDQSQFLKMLADIVGPQQVLTECEDKGRYLTDTLGYYTGEAIAVVRPANTQEVAAIAAKCNAHDVSITAQGGNTGLAGGSVPTSAKPAILLSLERMRNIREINANARTATVEAGVVLAQLHEAALEHGLMFPLFFGARGSCTIGGNLATNAGGSNVVRYGNTRELCFGIEAVMADGTIVDDLSGLRKDNTGYDLRHLLIGSEGTLGIITAAVLKLVPAPKVRATAFLETRDLATALDLLNAVQDATGGLVEAFEYMPGNLVDTLCEHCADIRQPLTKRAETGILLEIASTRVEDAATRPDGMVPLVETLGEILAKFIEQDLILDAVLATSEQQRMNLWHMRESTYEAVKEESKHVTLDISLPLDRIVDFMSDLDRDLEHQDLRQITVSHLGDGNLHCAILPNRGDDYDAERIAVAENGAYDLVQKYSGSMAAEHGIGQSRRDMLRHRKNPGALSTMTLIKKALDPNNILNPGKVLSVN